MDAHAEPQPIDLSLLLPRSVYWHIVHELQTSLPSPVTLTPEARAHRDHHVIAQIAAMLPANADEAELAAECVAARAHARDCQREAQSFRADSPWFLKCHAQATAMLRTAQSARRRLQSLQAERRQREADPAAADQAAWTEHCAIGLMAQALEPAPPVAMAEPPPEPEPEPPVAEPALEAEAPPRDLIAEAELYAAMYPRRAALIRRAGRVPDNVSLGPPDDHLVPVLVHGQTPALLALDRIEVEAGAV